MHPTTARRAAGAIAATAALVALGGVPAAVASPADDDGHKVTLCHATGSDTNPYVVVTVDVASPLFRGHDGHDGPIWSPDHDKHWTWGDIIPAFEHDGVSYPDQNLDGEGQIILDDGCTFGL